MQRLCTALDYVIPLLFLSLNIEYVLFLIPLYHQPWSVIREALLNHIIPLSIVCAGIFLSLAARLACFAFGYRAKSILGLKPDMNWNFWKYYVPAYLATATLLGLHYAAFAVKPLGLIAAIMIGFYPSHLIILSFSCLFYLRPFPFDR